MNEYSKIDLAELESQLSMPTGDKGIQIGDEMFRSNQSMIFSAFNILENHFGNENAQALLELGFGNGKHLPSVLKNGNLSYFGLEMSTTMLNECQKVIHSFKSSNSPFLSLYDGENIPYTSFTFDGIVTINSLYFWNNPILLLSECYRVLRLGGICVVTYASKRYMESLPFVSNQFKLYADAEIQSMAKSARFKKIQFTTSEENIVNKLGNTVKRIYTHAILRK